MVTTLYYYYYYYYNHFTALFPGPPGWADARRELLDFMVQGKINRGRHIDHHAGRHSIRTNQCPPPPSPHFLQAGCPSCCPTNSGMMVWFDAGMCCIHQRTHCKYDSLKQLLEQVNICCIINFITETNFFITAFKLRYPYYFISEVTVLFTTFCHLLILFLSVFAVYIIYFFLLLKNLNGLIVLTCC